MPEYRIKLSETQQRFVFDKHQYALFLGGVGAGKSHAGAVKPMLQVFPGKASLGMVVAPTYPMLRDATLRTALEVWEPLVQKVVHNEMRVELKNGHEIIFRSADEPDRLRAVNAAWVWGDEPAMWHPDVWPIVIGRLRQHGVVGRAWLTGTPKGMNWLYDVFVVKATDQTAIFKASTRSNPFLDTAYVDSLRSQYDGRFAAQELDAEFIADDEDALIQYAWLAAAKEKTATYIVTGGDLVAGVDVAGPGMDETVLVVRQGTRILDVRAWPDADAWDWCIGALKEWKHKGLRHVNVDAAGIGWGLCREIEREGFSVSRINVGESPETDQEKDRFLNLRAVLWWTLRERFKDGDVAGLTDNTMLGQLASVHWSLNNDRKRIAIEKKADAVKRGVKSPDRAEALMLAFAPPSRADRLAEAYRRQVQPRA